MCDSVGTLCMMCVGASCVMCIGALCVICVDALCAAMFKNQWRRARVESVQWAASTYISVFFIDFGNIDVVTMDR